MAYTDRDRELPAWSQRVRAVMAGLFRPGTLRAAAGVAVVAAGLAAAGGANWAVVATRQSMHGRMALYARYTPRASMVHVGFIEIAENTP